MHAAGVLITVKYSTGELLPPNGGTYYGQGRQDDTMPSRSQVPVAIRFVADDLETRMLLPNGTSEFSLDLKPRRKYDLDPIITHSAWTAPNDPATGDYTGKVDTGTDEANALLSPNNPDGNTPEADEPDSVPLMAQLSWRPPGQSRPTRSQKWGVALDNSVRHETDGLPSSAGLGAPPGDYSLVGTRTSGVRAWLATSVFGRVWLNIADAVAGRTALGLGTAATKNTGTGPGSVLLLDSTDLGAGRLPVVDGSQLTNIPGPSFDDLTDILSSNSASVRSVLELDVGEYGYVFRAATSTDATYASTSFDGFFQTQYGFNTDISLPGNGSASFAYGNFTILPDGTVSIANQAIALLSSGDIYANNFNGDKITLYQSIGLWEVPAPTSQPATPTTLAEVIALLQSYGICQ